MKMLKTTMQILGESYEEFFQLREEYLDTVINLQIKYEKFKYITITLVELETTKVLEEILNLIEKDRNCLLVSWTLEPVTELPSENLEILKNLIS